LVALGLRISDAAAEGLVELGLRTSEAAALGFTPRDCDRAAVCAEEQKHREEIEAVGSYSCAILFDPPRPTITRGYARPAPSHPADRPCALLHSNTKGRATRPSRKTAARRRAVRFSFRKLDWPVQRRGEGVLGRSPLASTWGCSSGRDGCPYRRVFPRA